MSDEDELETADTTVLTDADWAEIDKLRCAWDSGGRKGLWEALDKLRNDDLVRYVTVTAAVIPDMVRNTFKDHMAVNHTLRIGSRLRMRCSVCSIRAI